ncbi:Ig-like domain-containing protein [Brucellaceae bacterium C25G]
MDDKDVITQEDFGQELNAEASMILKITKDNAKADGSDPDIAHVTFENVDDSITNVRIDYAILSGNAVFLENNSKNITKHTNSALSSTVSFIDNTAGSGTIKATPYFNPSAAPAPVTYNFVAPQRSMSLSVNKDNQQADGKGFDEVIASLKDNEGMPVAGEKLIFTIPSNGTSQFKEGGTSLTLATNENGQCTIRAIDTGKKDIAVTVTCTSSSDATLAKSVDVHFKQSISVASFKLITTVGRGVAGDGTPAQVRAIITPNTDSPPTDYIVHFSSYGPVTIPYYLCTITPSGILSGKDADPELDVKVKVSGITSVDAWIHDLDVPFAATNIQAELKTISGEHVAYSEEPNPSVSFSAAGSQPVPPPTQPPSNKYTPKLNVSYYLWNGVSHSDYAAVLYITAINGYSPPARLTITSHSPRLTVAEAIGNELPNMGATCTFSTNFYNRGHGEVYARDPTFNEEKDDTPRSFTISDGNAVLWSGYITFISNKVVDQTG